MLVALDAAARALARLRDRLGARRRRRLEAANRRLGMLGRMGDFFHAVGVFFHHLAAVRLGAPRRSRSRCHIVKLVLPRDRVADDPQRGVPRRPNLKFRSRVRRVRRRRRRQLGRARARRRRRQALPRQAPHRGRVVRDARADADRRDAVRLRRRGRDHRLGARDRRAARRTRSTRGSRRSTGSSSSGTSSATGDRCSASSRSPRVIAFFCVRAARSTSSARACGTGFAILGDRPRVPARRASCRRRSRGCSASPSLYFFLRRSACTRRSTTRCSCRWSTRSRRCSRRRPAAPGRSRG